MSKNAQGCDNQRMDSKHTQIIRHICHNQSLGDFISFQQITNLGTVNSVYRVKTTQDEWIMRLNDEDSISQFQKEAWCIKLARSLNIPTPSVKCIGEIEATIFMVLSYQDGENGTFHADKVSIWKGLGEYTSKIHQISVQGFGDRLLDNPSPTFADRWSRYLDYNISSLHPQDQLIKMAVLNPRTSSLLKSIFQELSQMTFQFGLCHGDISEKNSLVDELNRVYLLDWGSAHAHLVPHFEFLEILTWYLDKDSAHFAAYLDAYGMSMKEFSAILPQIQHLRLLITTDKLRWALDRKPDRVPEFAKRLLLLLVTLQS